VSQQHVDVAILGAGPAGLFAAHRLAGSGLQILVIDKGDEPARRQSVTCGVGGAGAFSDGKLNLTPEIGGDAASFHRTPEEVQRYIDEFDAIITRLGIEGEYSGVDPEGLRELKRLANKYGIEFVAGKQKHMGTDRVRRVVETFYRELERRGIQFLLNTEVERITHDGGFHLKTATSTVTSPTVIAAPGRAGAYWLREQAQTLGIETHYGPIDVGIRVEFPATVYERIERVMYDAKFRLHSDTYDDVVRTFCTNPRGYVTREDHGSFVLVNGQASHEHKTENTNFALLSRVRLTDPVEDTTEYGRAIAILATTIGGGHPLIQRFKDLQAGRRSTWSRIHKAAIRPTLREATPGDISMALPSRIVTNLVEGLERLNNLIEGISSDNTLLYAPEIKFYDTRYEVTPNLETTLGGFFVAGDASGHSRGIVYSAVTGMLAAEAILQRAGPTTGPARS